MKLYDFIVIDCPPVMFVSDAIPIGNVVDGTVFVCSSQLTGRKVLRLQSKSYKRIMSISLEQY